MDMNFLAIACWNIETLIAEVRMNLPVLLRYGNNCEGKSAIFVLNYMPLVGPSPNQQHGEGGGGVY